MTSRNSRESAPLGDARDAGTSAAPGAPLDVAGLFDLARRKSKDGRQELFSTVRDLFFDTGEGLSERERALMGDILRRLVADVEVSVRRSLADKLAKEPRAPADLVKLIANDVIEVSYPVLVASNVLADVDLIEIIRHRTQAHQLAIASRRAISTDVSEALIGTGNEDVIAALLSNHGAEISSAMMAYLVDKARTVDRFQEPLVRRADLPHELARSMFLWVSAALRQHLAKNHAIDLEILDDSIEQATQEEFGERPVGYDYAAAERVVVTMKQRGLLTERSLLQFLRQNETPLFEAAFAALVGIKLNLVRRILFEHGAECLAVACRASNFQDATFKAIYLLSREAIRKADGAAPEDAKGAMAMFRQIKPAYARSVVQRWRRDPQYQYALNKLEN